MQVSIGDVAVASHSRRRPGFWGWILLAPMLLWLVAFVVVPGVILLVYSFCERGTDGPVSYVFTLENYHRVFSGTYLKILSRSVWYAALTTFFCVVLAYPVAYFIARQPEAKRNRLLMLVMIPFWTSFLIRTYAWITILNQNGLLNGLLEYTRLVSEPWEILYTPNAVLLGLTYSYLPFMILPIYGSAEKLDQSLIDASLDLGAGPVKTFQHVIVPLTSPGIKAGILLVFIPAIGMFAVTELMGGGQVPMVGNVIQNQFLQARDWPFGAALGMTLVLLFALAYLFAAGGKDSRRQAER